MTALGLKANTLCRTEIKTTCSKPKAPAETPFLALLFLGESLLFCSHFAQCLQGLTGKQVSAQKPDAFNSQRGNWEACLWAKRRSGIEKSYSLVKWSQQGSTGPPENKFWIETSSPSPFWPKVTMTVTIYKQKMVEHFSIWEVKEKTQMHLCKIVPQTKKTFLLNT